MIDILILYYVVCFMFLLGYAVQDDKNHGVTRVGEYVLDFFGVLFLAPLAPVFMGMRIANIEKQNND